MSTAARALALPLLTAADSAAGEGKRSNLRDGFGVGSRVVRAESFARGVRG